MDIGASGIALGSSLMSVDTISSNLAAPAVRSSVAGSASRRFGQASSRVPTNYRPSPAVSERVRRQFLDFVASKSGPQGAKAVDRAFGDRAVEVWARQAAADGLRPGDVADALAEYWVQNWMMANRIDNTDGAQVRAVRDQVRGTLSSNPALARLTEAQRQEMAEVFMYNQLLQGEVYTEARRNGHADNVQKLSDAAVARFQHEMGVDLRQLALTGHGFVRRG